MHLLQFSNQFPAAGNKAIEYQIAHPELAVYPNPTTGVANISYQLGNANSLVSLEVLNMLGETIGVLVNTETQQNGNYTYQYNADASGVYFVRLTVDGKISTQKLVFTGK